MYWSTEVVHQDLQKFDFPGFVNYWGCYFYWFDTSLIGVVILSFDDPDTLFAFVCTLSIKFFFQYTFCGFQCFSILLKHRMFWDNGHLYLVFSFSPRHHKYLFTWFVEKYYHPAFWHLGECVRPNLKWKLRNRRSKFTYFIFNSKFICPKIKMILSDLVPKLSLLQYPF